MGKFDSYVICTSPRSGSTLLCSLLFASGVAGNPKSYFHKPVVREWLEHFELSPDESASEAEILQLIFNAAKSRGTVGTGLFGLRMQRPSFRFFIEQLNLLHPGLSTDKQRIEAEFGNTCFIHLTRLDKVAQAVSLLKAEQTGLWHVARDGSELERLSAPQLPSYNAEAIRQHVTVLSSYERCWAEWFSSEKIEPYRITYEALSSDSQGTVIHLLSHLGVDCSAAADIVPGVTRMSDSVSREWVERFRTEL